MSKNNSKKAAKLEQGRDLASHLYDLKMTQLEKISTSERETFLANYPLLNVAEFEDLRRQVIQAKTAAQTQVGWFSIPHDITVLVFVLVTALVSWQVGLVAAIASLVLLESIFQMAYEPKLYPALSLLVWLTYPAYALLAWVLYTRGMAWYWIALAVAGIWGGTFLAAIVARYPMQLISKAKLEAAKRKAREAAEALEKQPVVNVQGKS